MTALELCTIPDFLGQGVKRVESAVCLYLLHLLCMLTHREEDVHELRTKGILQGGAGLSNKKGILSAELSLTPLSLDDERGSFLLNMAALELCTTSNFLAPEAADEDSAVCSYLLLLSMLVHREKDVHELRTRHLLQGGAGLSNKEALDFFTSLQSLRQGRCYARVMVQIENYRRKRPWIKVYALCYRYRTTIDIAWATSALVGFISIIVTLKRAL